MPRTLIRFLAAFLAAAALAGCWIGYRRTDLAFALFGWNGMCM